MSTEQHQLAAILFTDIVGYTALMQRDEDGAMTLIRRYHEVLDTCVGNHHGKVANNYGDGSLCIFPSALNAMNAAIGIQIGLREEPVVPLRIGLHIGEVFFEEGRVFGDGVNVASRIQSMGQANSILFSREIYDKIKNHPEFSTVSLGKFAFKNVQDDMEVFALANPGLQVPSKNTLEGKFHEKKDKRRKWLWLALAVGLVIASFLIYNFGFKRSGFTGSEKSIAIIPFFNKDSLDKNNETLCTSVPDYIASLLSNSGVLEVKGLNAAHEFRGSKKSTEEISVALNHPAALLSGWVEKLGNNIEVFVYLTDVATDKMIWSKPYQYNTDKDEIISIQSDVANQVARELNVKMSIAQQNKINKEPTTSKEAFASYLKGNYFLGKSVSEGIGEKLSDSALKYLLEAVRIDSTFALAWVGLADIYNENSNGGKADLELNNKGLSAIFKALQFDPENSDAFAIWGDLQKKYTLNSRLSLYLFDKAIQLNPNNPKAYFYKAQVFIDLNRFPEAKENIEKSLQLDPVNYISQLDPWENYALTAGDTVKLKYLLNKYANTANNLKRANQKGYYLHSGKFDSLLLVALESHDTTSLVIAYMGLGQQEKARALASLRINNLKRISEDEKVVEIANLYILINENQKALEYLNRAYNLRNYGVSDIMSAYLRYSIRKEEGYKELAEKIVGH